jgi:hypothetical protein
MKRAEAPPSSIELKVFARISDPKPQEHRDAI